MSLRHRRRRSLFFGGSDAYAVGVYIPPLVFDFASEFYRNRSAPSTFNNSLTYTGASAKTMVDSDGLLKWAPHNLVKYSEQFDNAAWLKSTYGTGLTPVVTANYAAAPDGSVTADRVVLDLDGGTGLDYSFLQQIQPAGFGYTRSVWLKLNTGTSAVVTLELSSALAKVTVTDSWQQFSFSGYEGSGYSSFEIGLRGSFATADSVDLLVWGAHYYRSDLGGMVDNPDRSDSYVPTTSAAVYLPRRGHHIYNGSTWVNEGIQLESEERTNAITYSEDFTDVAWTKVGTATLAVDATGPDGETSAVTLVDSSGGGSGEVYVLFPMTVLTSTAYTASCFMKADQLSIGRLRVTNAGLGGLADAFFDLSGGTVGTTGASVDSATIENRGDGWYRCAMSFTSDSVDTSLSMRVYATQTDAVDNVDRDGTSSILIYGAQFEAGSTPSSYIPTSGATVTRSAETLTVAAANLPYSAVNMSIQMDGEMTYADEGANYQIRPLTWTNDSQNRIQHMIYTTGALTGEFRLDQESLNVADSVISVSELSPGINVSFNYAVRHGATFINAAFDGAAVTENSTPTSLPDLSAATLLLSPDAMGTIGKFRMWDEDLGDTGIAEASDRTYTNEFAMIVSTTTASETFTIPCQNVGTFNAVIDWGDNSDHSTITAYNDADLVHTYNSPGDHVIRITGTFPNIYFNNVGDKLKVKSVENLGTVGWISLNRAFNGCTNMASFTAGTTDTSAVLSMPLMFNGCTSLTTLDVSGFNTAAVTDMSYMFYNCTSLTSLDVSSFNTAAVTSMNNMFRGCSSLTTLDTSGFSTTLVTNMGNMFRDCTSLTTLDVSNFNTAAVATISAMFYNCTSLTTLDVSGFNTALVTNMGSVFYGCSSVTALDVSSFNTALVISMASMFRSCSSLTTLDVSNFNTAAVTDMNNMFRDCTSLTDIVGVDTFDIGGLNSTTDLTNFALNVTLPTARYDALLLAWEAQDPFDGMAPNFGSSTYTGGGAVATAHASLISRDGWTITDGGIA